jgi:hypothetical protein
VRCRTGGSADDGDALDLVGEQRGPVVRLLTAHGPSHREPHALAAEHLVVLPDQVAVVLVPATETRRIDDDVVAGLVELSVRDLRHARGRQGDAALQDDVARLEDLWLHLRRRAACSGP